MSFTGTFYHGVDPKNRIFIPSIFREELGDNFYIFRAPDRCLCLYSGERWLELVEKNENDGDTREQRIKRRKFFSHVAPCKMDKQGRITLDAEMIKYADLGEEVAIVGMGNCIEIWNEDAWKLIDSDREDDLSEGVYL